MENGISVIMISYLSDYKNSRKYPKEKFIRAVNSFINQTHEKKELIIVSDGCEITNQLYLEHFDNHDNIYLIRAPKQKSNWPGRLRECARTLANYEWITYLDSDDMILNSHLSRINDEVNKLEKDESILFNKRIMFPIVDFPSEEYYRITGIQPISLESYKAEGKKFAFSKCVYCRGTWQISHKNNILVKWTNSDNRGEDSEFIENIKKQYKFAEYEGYYIICHYLYGENVIWEI